MIEKFCRQCLSKVGKNNRSELCNLCREREWVRNHRERSNEIKRNYVRRHPRRRLESINKYRSHNRMRSNAWAVLEYHVKKGDVAREEVCEMCKKSPSAHAHHPNPAKALEVIWVCNPCHKKAHGYGGTYAP